LCSCGRRGRHACHGCTTRVCRVAEACVALRHVTWQARLPLVYHAVESRGRSVCRFAPCEPTRPIHRHPHAPGRHFPSHTSDAWCTVPQHRAHHLGCSSSSHPDCSLCSSRRFRMLRRLLWLVCRDSLHRRPFFWTLSASTVFVSTATSSTFALPAATPLRPFVSCTVCTARSCLGGCRDAVRSASPRQRWRSVPHGERSAWGGRGVGDNGQ